MSDIRFTSGGVAGTIRHGGAFEAIASEPVVLPFVPTFVDGVATGHTITGSTVVFTTPGRRRFRSADGMLEVTICACEPAALARLHHGHRTGHGYSDSRLTLRSIVQHAPWPFDGLASQLDGRALAPFGAPNAPPGT